MKKRIYKSCFWSIALLLFLNIDAMAELYEWGMKVTSNGTNLIADDVYLYVKSDVNSGMLTPYRHHMTSNTPWQGANGGENFICDIDDNDTPTPTWPSIVDGDYYLMIDNYYCELGIGPPPGGNAGDFTIVYNRSNHTFVVTSNSRDIDWSETQPWPSYNTANVTLDQKAENGTQTIGFMNRWNGAFVPVNNLPASLLFSLSSTQAMQADQNIESGQKYINWTRNGVLETDLINRHLFLVQSSDNNFTSHFKTTNDATLQSVLTDNGTNIGAPNFQDPWLVDGTDPDRGNSPINEGTSAPFKPVTYSQKDIGINSIYHGIFLNLFVTSGAYYSLQAPVTTTVGGYTAIFTGWSVASAQLQQVGTNPSGFDQKAVVFTGSGATVTANYSRTTVSSNVTLPAGTYNFIGNLTVNSGATLTLSSGAALNFPSGAGLVVNGALVASGATFNFVQSPSYPYLTGITINSNGSSLTNCTISGADQPLVFTNVNTATISGCTINNSIFSSSQAISVSNSTPTITTVHINGLTGATNSSNGVRYTNGRGGTISGSIIQNCGAGNGIVIQGNSNPTITYNTIQGNHYHGIIVTGNGTGTPNINNNDLESNGIVNGTKTYCGIVFDGSTGYVQSNTIRYSNYGIYCENSGSPQAYISMGDIGDNIITNNLYGIDAYNHSFPEFGYGDAQLGRYYAVCNEIHDNQSYDVAVQSNSGLYAMYNWWGQYPVNMAKHYHDATSTLGDGNPEQYSGNCPLSGGRSIAVSGTTEEKPLSVTGSVMPLSNDSSLTSGMNARCEGNWDLAKSIFNRVLQSSASAAYRENATVLLFNLFQESGDTSIVSLIAPYSFSADELGSLSAELLASMYAAMGRLSDAETVNNQLRVKYAGTEIEQRALARLASLSAFDRNYADKSSTALNELVKKFGSSVDMGLVVALNTANNKEFSGTANPSISDGQDNASAVELSNYPNPFNPTTTIYYQIPKDGRVTIKVFDAIGREVTTLVDEFKPSGRYSVKFDASRLSSGIYFYSIRSGDYNAVKKMSLIK
jgi:parallel beta-helix repeat protein